MKKISELLVLTFTPSLLMRLVLVCGIVTFMFGGCVAIPTIEALGPLPPPQPIGTFTDSRDGQTYRTVKIGNLTWMAENLNFVMDSSWCYDDVDSNCKKYGRLYNWDVAMIACPEGWFLPDHNDWDNLAFAVGGRLKKDKGHYFWNVAGKKLKSETGWNNKLNGGNGNGTDEFGFMALPGGSRGVSYRNNTSILGFYNVGIIGLWWSDAERGSYNASYRSIQSNDNIMDINSIDKSFGLSVRCIK